MTSELDKCKKYLRSLLLASKGGVPASKLYDDYKKMVGDTIPWRKFNYQSLEMFLRSIPDVCRITCRGREVMIEGVATPETSHIEKFIQKSKGKRGGGGGGGARPKTTDHGKYHSSQTLPSNNHSLRPTIRPKAPAANATPTPIKTVKPTIAVRRPTTRHQPAQCPPPPNNVASSTPSPITNEPIKVWSGRINKLLMGRTHGLYKLQVEKFYEKQWYERLPSNWVDIMRDANYIRLDKNTAQSSPMNSTNPIIFPFTSVPSNNNAQVTIPSGSYPKITEWNLLVTNVVSTSNMWVVFTDGEKRLEEMKPRLEIRHHMGRQFNADVLSPGMYYSAILESAEVARVKVLKIDRLKYTCQCFLVDHGTEQNIKWDNLKELDKEFLTTPVSAMRVSILGIDDIKVGVLVNFMKDKLLDKRYVGVEVEKGPNNIPKVMLLDGDKVVSDELSRQLKKFQSSPKFSVTVNNNYYNGGTTEAFKSLPATQLPNLGEFYDLKISQVLSPKEIYVQPYTSLPKYSVMEQEMALAYSNNRRELRDHDLVPGMIFAVKHCGTWRRGKIVVKVSPLPGSVDTGKLEYIVNLVDLGNTVVMSIEFIRELDPEFYHLSAQVRIFVLLFINLNLLINL